MEIGIYKIISPSGKVYIGQSKDIKTRWRDYKYSKSQPRLNRSFIKYGIENHIFEIVELCNIENLNELENYWQLYYDVIGKNGLNCSITDVNSKKRIYSEISKQKMSEGRKGEKNHRFGKPMPEYVKQKLVETNKGKTISQETKDKRKLTIGDKQKGSGNPRARKVICTLTGKIFDCITDCAKFLNMNRKTLNDQLIGRYPNKTSYILL